MSERLHHLDGLRGIAALVVVLHHHVLAFNFALYSGRTQDSQFAGDVFLSGFPLTPAMPAGLAVCLFFVLSGYVLARASLKSPLGLLGQGTKRYVRLAIPILCVSILTWIFSALGLMRNKQMAAVVQSAWLEVQLPDLPSFAEAVAEGAYGALIMGTNTYNSSLWTMRNELIGSIVVILLVWIARSLRISYIGQALFAGIMMLAFAAAFHASFIALFGVGATLMLWNVRSFLEPLMRVGPLVLAALLFGFLLGNISISQARPGFMTSFVMLAPMGYSVNWGRMTPEHFWNGAGAVVLLATVDASARLRAAFSRQFCRYLGDISFSLYLVHVPVLLSIGSSLYLWLLGAGAVPVLAIGATVAVSIGSSILLSHVITRSVEIWALRFSSLCGEWTDTVSHILTAAWTRPGGRKSA